MTVLDKYTRSLAKLKTEHSREYQKLIEMLRPEFEKREDSNAYKKVWNRKHRNASKR